MAIKFYTASNFCIFASYMAGNESLPETGRNRTG